jgi:hypothetical protein
MKKSEKPSKKRKFRKMILPKESFSKLLIEEKAEAGLGPDDLYYVGMADTAGWWWCGRKSVLDNREMEFQFFLAHLEDKVRYTAMLGYLPKAFVSEVYYPLLCSISEPLPYFISDFEKLAKTLKTCQLSKTDIERVLELRAKMKQPALTKKQAEKIAELHGTTEVFKEGIKAELLKAEKYPTVRWAYSWKDFMVVGVPDGITDRFVYEFKSTRNYFTLRHIKPVAFAQADLYGYFFERPLKRVQIFIRETNETKTWMELVDRDHAEETLERLRRAVREGELPQLPAEWKCRVCRRKEECARTFSTKRNY